MSWRILELKGYLRLVNLNFIFIEEEIDIKKVKWFVCDYIKWVE